MEGYRTLIISGLGIIAATVALCLGRIDATQFITIFTVCVGLWGAKELHGQALAANPPGAAK